MGKYDLLNEKKCKEHNQVARLIGCDSDGFGVYECPDGHGLLEDGHKIPLNTARIFTKI